MSNKRNIPKEYNKIWHIVMSYNKAKEIGIVYSKINKFVKVFENKEMQMKNIYLAKIRLYPTTKTICKILELAGYELELENNIVYGNSIHQCCEIDIWIKIINKQRQAIVISFGGIDGTDIGKKYQILANYLDGYGVKYELIQDKEKDNCRTLKDIINNIGKI